MFSQVSFIVLVSFIKRTETLFNNTLATSPKNIKIFALINYLLTLPFKPKHINIMHLRFCVCMKRFASSFVMRKTSIYIVEQFPVRVQYEFQTRGE